MLIDTGQLLFCVQVVRVAAGKGRGRILIEAQRGASAARAACRLAAAVARSLLWWRESSTQAVEQRVIEARPIALDATSSREARLPDVSVVRINRRRRPMVVRPHRATREKNEHGTPTRRYDPALPRPPHRRAPWSSALRCPTRHHAAT